MAAVADIPGNDDFGNLAEVPSAESGYEYYMQLPRCELTPDEFEKCLQSKVKHYRAILPDPDDVLKDMDAQVDSLKQKTVFRLTVDTKSLDGNFTTANKTYESQVRKMFPEVYDSLPPLKPLAMLDFVTLEEFQKRFLCAQNTLLEKHLEIQNPKQVTVESKRKLSKDIDSLISRLSKPKLPGHPTEAEKTKNANTVDAVKELVFNVVWGRFVAGCKTLNLCLAEDYATWETDVQLLMSFSALWLCLDVRERTWPLDAAATPKNQGSCPASLHKVALTKAEFTQAVQSKLRSLKEGHPGHEPENLRIRAGICSMEDCVEELAAEVVIKTTKGGETINQTYTKPIEAYLQSAYLSQPGTKPTAAPGVASPANRQQQSRRLGQGNKSYHNQVKDAYKHSQTILMYALGETIPGEELVPPDQFCNILDAICIGLITRGTGDGDLKLALGHVEQTVRGRFLIDCIVQNDLLSQGQYTTWEKHVRVLIGFVSIWLTLRVIEKA